MTTPLLTLAEVKTYLGITSNTSDAVLTALILEVSAAVDGYTKRTLGETTHTELRDGNDALRLLTCDWPLVSVSSLKVNGVSVLIVTDFTTRGCRVSLGGRELLLQGGLRFCRGLRNVEVTYVAGYGGTYPLPEDLKLAALQSVSAINKARTRPGVTSKTLATESISYGGPSSEGGSVVNSKPLPLPTSAIAILSAYVNTVPETPR